MSEGFPGGARFRTTAWSAVLAAGDPAAPEGRRGMEFLCRTYWGPVYHFLRRRGCGPDEARDLAQEYFRSFLERNIPGKARRELGKFRTFVLATLQRFLLGRRRPPREVAAGDLAALPQRAGGPGGGRREDRLSPEEIFHRRWAQAAVAQALQAMREFCGDERRRRYYEVLRAYLAAVDEGKKPSYRALGGQFGATENDITNWLHRGRRIFQRFLRQAVGESVLGERELEEELRDLRRLLS